MRIFRHYTGLPASARGAVVAIGNFDGVHLGHQAVIGAAAAEASKQGRPLAVLTFEPHPRSYFRPNDPPFRLTPFRIKMRHIEALGVHEAFVLHFDAELAAHTADAFVTEPSGLRYRSVNCASRTGKRGLPPVLLLFYISSDRGL